MYKISSNGDKEAIKIRDSFEMSQRVSHCPNYQSADGDKELLRMISHRQASFKILINLN